MSIYKGLWKKEMVMMRGYHVVMLLVFIALTCFMMYQRSSPLDEHFLLDLSTMSMIVLPATLLFSLNMETNQLSMFLFSKLQISKQIQLKFLHGLFLTGIYFGLMIAMAIIFFLFNMTNYTFAQLLKILLATFLFILFISIQISVSVYIAWVIHQWLKENLGFILSIVAVFFLLYVVIRILGSILSVLSFLENVWLVEAKSFVDVPFTIFMVDDQLSLSLLLTFGLILYGFYRFFTWVLVKRVEV
ncbi:hypothetical protein [Gracilibacillus thailandensis]|uniref:Uncharacterized protein n=1 Tax=Gracilibacillus thailandensis TaxID=563735 RepID=A0A6N7QU24_9BACI|nr:hypothetical protein [Gracilibacillus thailandensis]MRI65627.1 hypothetical protein [Gracilibacillus thailandensis]